MKKQSLFSSLLKSCGYVALFFASQAVAAFLAEVVILVLLMAKGMTSDQIASSYESIYYSVMYEIMLLSALLFFGVLLIMKRNRFSSHTGLTKASGASVLSALCLGFACYIGAGLLINLANLIPAVQSSQEAYMETYEKMTSYNSALWPEVLYACLVGPIIEEVLCRGLVLKTLKQNMAPGLAIFLSALTFALIHGNLYQVVFTLPLGLVLGLMAHRFQSVWPPIFLHMAFNASNYLMQMGTYFGYEEESEMWIFFAYAAYLFCLVCLPIGLILLKTALEKKSCAGEALWRREAPATPDFEALVIKHQNPVQTQIQPTEKGDSMASPEMIIVGLGNPGEKYASNRHNCGFMALDYIALRQGVKIQNLKFRALTAETVMGDKKVLLLKPQTFMNSSGESVREAANFYKIPPENILVIFDDISFAPGVFRIRKSGSAGGHNGIKSIIQQLSSDAFPRIKMGVGTPPEGWELMNWVLGNPPKEDLEHIISSMEDVYSTAKLFVAEDLDRAISSYNGKSH